MNLKLFKEKEARKLLVKLPLMKARLMSAGLFRSGHAMQAAVNEIGYEVADYLEESDRS